MDKTTAFQFTHTHKVRFAEIDAGQALYHPRYLEIADAAREKMFEDLMHPISKMLEHGNAFSVVDLQIKYRKPCFLSNNLSIQTSIIQLRPKVLVLQQNIYNNSWPDGVSNITPTLCTEIKVTLVFVSLKQMKSCAIPVSLLDAFHRLFHEPNENSPFVVSQEKEPLDD